MLKYLLWELIGLSKLDDWFNLLFCYPIDDVSIYSLNQLKIDSLSLLVKTSVKDLHSACSSRYERNHLKAALMAAQKKKEAGTVKAKDVIGYFKDKNQTSFKAICESLPVCFFKNLFIISLLFRLSFFFSLYTCSIYFFYLSLCQKFLSNFPLLVIMSLSLSLFSFFLYNHSLSFCFNCQSKLKIICCC